MTDKNILQRYEERRKRIAEERMLEEEAAKKRAYAAARQIVRKKAEETAGGKYEQLGPTQRETVDRAVADKELVKKVALRLLPKYKTGNRDSSFTHGHKLDNHGQPEGDAHPVQTFKGNVKEDNAMQNFINDKFSQNFKKGEESANAPGGKKDKKSPVVQYSKFGEQMYDALERKSEKTGIDISILGEVFVRGLDAHSNANTKLTREQYAFARVNSFISKGKTYYTEDSDLAENVEQLHELGGDQHYGDSKGAFSKGAKGTPITSKKMANYALDGLENELKAQRQTKQSVDAAKKRYGLKEEQEEDLKPVSTIEKIAKKHGISVDEMKARLKEGIKVEKEHTKEANVAATIALKHLSEKPDYYSKLKKYVEEVDLDEGRAPGRPSIKRYTRNDGTTALKSLNKWGKRKDWRDTEGGLAKAKAHAGVDKLDEEIEHIDEISKATLKSYSQKAEKQTRGNQPHGTDALRKRTNREQGLKAAYNKHYGYKVKVAATEEVEHTNENFIDGKGPGKPGDAARHGLKGKSAAELRKIRSSETASPRKKQLAHWLLNMHHNESVTENLKDPEDNPCWDNYKPVGTKKKNGKTVPNCVPEETNSELRAKVTAVARPGEEKMRKHVGRIGDTEQKLTRQGEIKNKIIDEEGNSQPDSSKRLIGTDSLVKAFKTDTPGETPAKPKKAVNESLNESFNIAYAAGIGQTYTAADLGMKMQGAFAHHPDTIKDLEELEAMEEDVTSKTRSPVIIPPIRKDDGTYTPARTVLRTTGKKIIKGDPNLTDGL